MRLNDKVAIVTGGGVGIGKAYAHGLAKEGAKVVVADIQDAEAQKVAADIKAAGGEAIAVAVDVTSPEKTQAMAAAALKAYGRIDILVNNAGLYSALKKESVHGNRYRRMGPGHGGQRQGTFSLCQSRLPDDEAAAKRQDHQYLIGHDPGRHAVFPALRIVESRRLRFHPRAGKGSRRRQYLRQLDHAWPDHLQPKPRRSHEPRTTSRPKKKPRPAARSISSGLGRHRHLSCLGRQRLHDRPVHRRRRRQAYALRACRFSGEFITGVNARRLSQAALSDDEADAAALPRGG